MSDKSDRPLVLYHGGCADGFCAAWVVHLVMGDKADYVPVSHGQEPPDVRGRVVIILDFSFKRSVMERICAEAHRVALIDHHKTAAEELAGFSAPNYRAVIDQSHSGAYLTWVDLFPGSPVPWVVQYVEDRDLWRWKLPESRAINAYLGVVPREFAAWSVMVALSADGPNDSMVVGGLGILAYQSMLVNTAVGHAVEIDLGGHKVLAVNATTLQSEIGERLAEGRPFGATYYIRSDGRKVWSLRSRGPGGIDVSEVARKMGGGGHPNAAGFEE